MLEQKVGSYEELSATNTRLTKTMWRLYQRSYIGDSMWTV